MIKGLHHNAYRCRDSEETRAFYEDFLGLPLAETLPIGTTKTGRQTRVLHTFYRMGDGSYLAFFEAPDRGFRTPLDWGTLIELVNEDYADLRALAPAIALTFVGAAAGTSTTSMPASAPT